MSGYCYDADALGREASKAARSRPWLVTHGYQDEVLPYDVTAQQMVALNAAGLRIDFRSYDKAHTINPDLMDIRTAIVSMFGMGPGV